MKNESKIMWEKTNHDKVLEYKKTYRNKNKDKIAAYRRKYNQEHKDLKKEYYKKWYEKNRDYVCGRMKKYVDENPEKDKARKILNDRVRRKIIIKPCQCSMCASTTRICGHHYDYSKPLDVIWLCYKCHMRIHRSTQGGK